MAYIPDRKGTTSVQTAKTSSAKLNSASSVGAVKTTTAQGQYSQTASNVEQVNLDTTFSTEKSTSTNVNYPTYNGETTLVGVGLDENGNTVVVDANYGQTPPPAPTFYQEVKQGDTLSQIARDNDVSLEELLEANPELKDHPDEINVGDKVKIPTSTQNNSSQTNAGTSSTSQTQMSGTTSSSSNQTNVGGTGTGTSSQADLKGYTVQSGDTLSQIARDNGISVEELAKFNNIEDPNYIEVGQYIQIPSSTETVDLSPFMTNYEVKRGDTLSQIAREYGIDYHYLAEINHINDPNYIEVGQTIIIPNKEAINQFLKEKLDTAIEHIQNGDSITDILADILNTQELVSNSNADNNEELISDITKKYQEIIHEALENGTLQEATTTLIGTITTVISAMKKSAQQKKNLETMMQLWDELFPKVADAIPTEEEVAQQMQQIWEQHFGQDTQQEEITSQEALDMAQQLWNEHFGEATVPEGEATIDEKEDIETETETQTDPNAEFPNETAPPEALDQIEDKENVDTTPETETTETEIQTEPITEASETEPVSESEETETEAIPNIPFPAFPSIDEENQMSESEAIDQMQQMWTEQFGETPVPETETIQDEVDNTQNITIEEDGNQTVTYDVDDQTTTNAEDIIGQNRQALENMDEELETREDEIEGQHEMSEDEALNQILEDIDNNDTTPETEPIIETPETETEVTIPETETEIQTEPITEASETETEVTISEPETGGVTTEPISESTETETERPIIEPLYEPQTEAISPYQDLMDAIPPSEDKEIDFSEIVPGSPVALAIEKYKDELINAKYAVVTKDIFIAVTEDTIDGSPHYVSHVVINDPSQIQGLLANGSYRSGMETPTSAATRADTRLLINGSHFDQDTMDGRQDLRPVINGNVNYNRMTIFDGKVMEGDAAGSMEICLDKDGRLFTPNMGTSSQQLVNDGVKFSFSSQDCHLINNGNYNVDGQDGPKESSVIGMTEPGEYYILTGESTNVGEADYLWNKGCTFAKSMDQGGSVALVMKINGEQKLIRTSTFPHTGQEDERAVGDFLAFF